MHNNDVIINMWQHHFMRLPHPSHSALALVTSDADRQFLIVVLVQVSIDVSLVLSKLLLLPQSPKMALEMTTLMSGRGET
eukprot:scaffold10946_cov104-Cyclotella_meneghiniana.AAC.2